MTFCLDGKLTSVPSLAEELSQLENGNDPLSTTLNERQHRKFSTGFESNVYYTRGGLWAIVEKQIFVCQLSRNF